MNYLDGFIIIVIGVTKVVAALVSIYLSTIISAAFYDGLSQSIRDGLAGMGRGSSELAAFMLLFIVCSAAIFWMITFSFKTVTERRGQFVILENASGAALAVVVGLLTIAMTLSVTVIVLGVVSQSSTSDGIESLGFLGRQIRGSELAPIILKLQPGITKAFEPWFPEGLPPILEPPAA
jgi:hypothetical protein